MDNSATLILGIALMIIMVGMGLSLTIADFKRVLKYPKAVFIGFLNQIILLPIIGYTLCQVMGVAPEIAVGIMILAACPGGPTSNMVTLLAKADVALSVSMTAVNSIVTLITIPLIVNFAVGDFFGAESAISAPVGTIAKSLVVVIAVPLAIGMLIRRFNPALADKMDKPVRIASASVLILVIVGLVIKERANFVDYFERSMWIVIALNVTTMLVGFIIAKIAKLNFKQALTICIESGNQNGTLAIHVAVVSLARPDFAIAAAVYSLLMYVTASVPVFIGNRRARQQAVKF